ncbi:hypothetical protein ACLBV5_09795 [Brevundimonas sp. M1A4_2e]
MRTSANAELAKKLLTEGKSRDEVMAATGLSHSTVQYHAAKLGLTRKVWTDWKAVQAAYDEGFSHGEIMERFGLSSSNIRTARQRGHVVMPNSYTAKRNRLTNSERIAMLEDSVMNMAARLGWLEMNGLEQ